MAEPHPEPIPAEEVDRRLRELARLYALGIALREVRFVDEQPKPPPDRVRERPEE